MVHKINIAVHVLAGTLALCLGLIILFSRKGNRFHTRLGRYFLYLLAIVVSTGFLGWLFFRSNSFLLMLTLLAGYNTYAGYRTIQLKEKQGTLLDVAIAITVLSTGLFYLFHLMRTDTNWAPSVIYPTMGGIVLITVYDLLKIFFLHRGLKTWWLYEHIYKIISAFSAILSAFVGTILPNLKPYSQVGPSSICMIVIVWYIWRQVTFDQKKKDRDRMS